MGSSILKTKIRVPQYRSDLVPRPHIINQLNQGLDGRLVLVSAPAGFGKTTLLSIWVQGLSLPVGWVSLDADDNTITDFLSYLIAAMQTVDPSIGQSILSALQSPQPPTPQAVLPFLMSDIEKCPELVLVLDDYHVITTQGVHEIITFLLQHSPPNLHLVIATRTDPSFPLSRLRSYGQLTEIRTADLQFSAAEASIFINQIRDLGLSYKDIATLNTRAEGWITGLLMAALSMQRREDRSQFVRLFSGTNRYILDYLIEEVLEQQTESIRKFLIYTSILTRLCGPLCLAVTEDSSSQELLEEMDRSNLFVIALDDQRHWYRYHHLFADLLRQRLQSTEYDRVSDLHRRASLWYEKNDYLSQAIEHSLAADEYELTIRQISKYVEGVWEHGDQAKLSGWLNSLPEDVLLDHPSLLAHHAFMLCFSGQFERAEAELARVEQRKDIADTSYLGMASIVRAYHELYTNNIETAAKHALFALNSLPGDQHMWRSLAFSIYGDVHAFYGHVPTCERIWRQALDEARLADSHFFAVVACAKLVVAQKRMSRLHRAARTFTEQLQSMGDNYIQVTIAGALYAVWGDVLLEWNRVDEALDSIQRGLSLSERQDYVAGIAWSALSTIHVHCVQADYNQAEQALEDLEHRIDRQQLPAWTINWLTAWKARLQLVRGDWKGAQDVLEAHNITLGGNFSYPNEVEYLALARVLIAKAESTQDSNSMDAAERLLKRLLEHLESKEWVDKIVETLTLLALLYQARGITEKALETMNRLLLLAESEGYIRVFIIEGLPMAQLLYQAVEADIMSEYAGCLLSHFPVPESELPSIIPSDLIEPLSSREIDVLNILAKGASNQEIAQALYIAPGTVKNHLKNIYGKLDVHNRTQAVARARTFGLLEE